MKRKAFFTLCLLFVAVTIAAQTKFAYNGKTMYSSEHRLYVNDALRTNKSRFTFGSVNEALRFAESKQSSDTAWTEVYIAPSVYWIDNPDDAEIRKPLDGMREPYGLMVSVNKLRLIGLSASPKEVVIACNRGQTQGAIGNFTMLHIEGSDVEAENITFGNYCNVDLNYAPNTRKSRRRRADAIVQAQLILCDGDRYRARNCEFISRLNLCPFVGARSVVFDDCYFECTDDALCGTGTYNHCRFTFFSSKPFYCTSKRGAVFYDCDIHSKVSGVQYLTKVSDPVTMINCRWTSDDPNLRIEWSRNPDPRKLCTMVGCTLNADSLCVPPTPLVPMPVSFPLFALEREGNLFPGKWSIDAYKPADTMEYDWTVDRNRSPWCFGEGVDGAEGEYGLIENVRGARLMYTGFDEENYEGQLLDIDLSPCKGPGQGFGSATGQYLDVCIKFDTQSLTGWGIRFERTPRYDKAVEISLVEYRKGTVARISEPTKCTLFRKGCHLQLKALRTSIVAEVSNSGECQRLEAGVDGMNSFGGIHIQHTGSVGASATVIKSLRGSYFKY